MNEKLYLRDPEQSVLGKKIVKYGLELINEIGFENFTFKKLASHIETTEASIYRYFENKHKLLIYLLAWYWSLLEYKIMYAINNVDSAEEKMNRIIKILTGQFERHLPDDFINEHLAAQLAMFEGSKVYLTRRVDEDNQARLFKPYKDLCNCVAKVVQELKPKYKFAHSLASTIIETAHSQKFFMNHLPSLTDFGRQKNDKKLFQFIHSLVLSE